MRRKKLRRQILAMSIETSLSAHRCVRYTAAYQNLCRRSRPADRLGTDEEWMMAIPVSLRDMIDEISLVGDEHVAYLNQRTGELVTLSREELSAAEEEASLDDFPQWQHEMIEKAGE